MLRHVLQGHVGRGLKLVSRQSEESPGKAFEVAREHYFKVRQPQFLTTWNEALFAVREIISRDGLQPSSAEAQSHKGTTDQVDCPVLSRKFIGNRTW